MRHVIQRGSVAATVLVLLAGSPTPGTAQDTGNDLPNPYMSITGWAKMPGARHWGATSAVDIDPDGVHIWVAERCGQNACEGSTLDPILKFDSSGQLVKSFGAGKINWPHGIHVDTEGNVWVTDARGSNGKGHQVHKFSPDGDLLMSLGTAGEAANDATHFTQPSDVVVGPDGSIYVGDRHGGTNSRQRIVKFDAGGNFVKDWSETGTGEGFIGVPHGLAFDSQGRVDRSVEPAAPKAWRSMRWATSTPPRSAHAISRSTSGGLKTRPLLSIETSEHRSCLSLMPLGRSSFPGA